MTRFLIDRQSRFLTWCGNPSKPARLPIVIFMTLLVTGFIGASQTGLFDRDEPRYAQATREMVASGDWVVPSFNGEPRLHKPVLIYWLMAASYTVFGDNALAARLPSILAGACAGTLIFLMVNRWWGRRCALWASLIWATVPLTLVESRMATTDSVLNLFTLAMLACIARLYQSPSRLVARLFWLAMGLSILTKGPVGLLAVVSAMLGCQFLSGIKLQWKWLRPIEGLAILATVVMPWVITATIQTHGDFLRFAVGRELLGRTVAPAEGHSGLPGYYLAMLAPLFFPWCCFLPMAVKRAWAKRSTDPRMGFLLGWAFGPLVVLELMATKLVHYHYSGYAALAILAASEISQLEQLELRPNLLAGGRFLRGSLITSIALAAMIFLGLAWVSTWAVAIPSLLIVAVFIWTFQRIIPALNHGQWSSVLRVTTSGWIMVCLLVFAWLVPAGDSRRLSSQVSSRILDQSHRLQVPIALGEFREPSLIFGIDSSSEIPISRSMTQTRSIVTERGAILMALSATELSKVQSMNDLEVQTLEKVEALDWDRGRRRSLTICLLTRRPEERLAELPGRSELIPNRATPDPVKRY